jgi:hypothetical protein
MSHGSTTDSAGDWVVESCTLPTAERPLRVAEFDRLFATALRDVERPAPTWMRWWLDASAETTARGLAERETSCCSFFDFSFDRVTADRLAVDVTVPAAQVAVLDVMAARMRSAAEARR